MAGPNIPSLMRKAGASISSSCANNGHDTASASTLDDSTDDSREIAVHNVQLDKGYPSYQLCIVTNIGRKIPQQQQQDEENYSDLVNVSDGTIRFEREWLFRWMETKPGREAKDAEEKRQRTLWTDDKTDVGLLTRVYDIGWRGPLVPTLSGDGEEPAIGFVLEYEG